MPGQLFAFGSDQGVAYMVLQDRTSIIVVDTQVMIVEPSSEPSGQ